jgi:C-terminal processing protease CtpA/Prc
MQANALLTLAPESAPVQLRAQNRPGTEDRTLFSNVFQLLRGNYVDPITPQRETDMARGAVRGMVDSLGDPDSRFLDPKERKLLDDASNGFTFWDN